MTSGGAPCFNVADSCSKFSLSRSISLSVNEPYMRRTNCLLSVVSSGRAAAAAASFTSRNHHLRHNASHLRASKA